MNVFNNILYNSNNNKDCVDTLRTVGVNVQYGIGTLFSLLVHSFCLEMPRMSCVWNVLFMKCPVYEMSCQCNVLLMKCHVNAMSCLWNVMSMQCPVYEISSQCNVLLMKCHVNAMSCLWNVMSMQCPVYEISCQCNVLLMKCHINEMYVLLLKYHNCQWIVKSKIFLFKKCLPIEWSI